jgi:hypothetical protein
MSNGSRKLTNWELGQYDEPIVTSPDGKITGRWLRKPSGGYYENIYGVTGLPGQAPAFQFIGGVRMPRPKPLTRSEYLVRLLLRLRYELAKIVLPW